MKRQKHFITILLLFKILPSSCPLYIVQPYLWHNDNWSSKFQPTYPESLKSPRKANHHNNAY